MCTLWRSNKGYYFLICRLEIKLLSMLLILVEKSRVGFEKWEVVNENASTLTHHLFFSISFTTWQTFANLYSSEYTENSRREYNLCGNEWVHLSRKKQGANSWNIIYSETKGENILQLLMCVHFLYFLYINCVLWTTHKFLRAPSVQCDDICNDFTQRMLLIIIVKQWWNRHTHTPKHNNFSRQRIIF